MYKADENIFIVLKVKIKPHTIMIKISDSI